MAAEAAAAAAAGFAAPAGGGGRVRARLPGPLARAEPRDGTRRVRPVPASFAALCAQPLGHGWRRFSGRCFSSLRSVCVTVGGYCAAAKEAQPLLQRAATSAVACVGHDSPTRSGRRGGRSRRLRRRWPRPHLVDLRLRDEDRIRPTRPGPGPCTAASTPARQAPQALQKSEAGIQRHGTRAQAPSAWLELMKETDSEPLRAEAGHPRETPWPVGF